jgi:hypothetical protein
MEPGPRQENVGEENKSDLLRLLFSSPTFSCLIEEFHALGQMLDNLLSVYVYSSRLELNPDFKVISTAHPVQIIN